MATEPESAVSRHPEEPILDDPNAASDIAHRLELASLMAPQQFGPIFELNRRATVKTMFIPWSIEESGEKRGILVFEVKGKRPGQLLIVFGGVHGDEDTGKESAQGAYETARD